MTFKRGKSNFLSLTFKAFSNAALNACFRSSSTSVSVPSSGFGNPSAFGLRQVTQGKAGSEATGSGEGHGSKAIIFSTKFS